MGEIMAPWGFPGWDTFDFVVVGAQGTLQQEVRICARGSDGLYEQNVGLSDA
jgi:hypothetical protein